MKMEKPAVNLTYRIKDKPPFGQIVLAAIQQLLAIMVATIAVPAAVGNGLTASAALCHNSSPHAASSRMPA